jgi:hypothetical protein
MFGAIGLFIGLRFLEPPGAFFLRFMALFPLAFAAFGAAIIVGALIERRRVRHGRLRTSQVLVRDERTEVAGGQKHTRALYFLTLESQSGRRHEYPVAGARAGRVSPGDMGVAYFRDDHLIEVRVVRV